MTTDELRDRLARALGWVRESTFQPWEKPFEIEHGWRHRVKGFQYSHPIDNTIDALAAVWQEELSGWRIQLKQETQSACPGVSWWRGNAFHSVHGFAVPANDPGLGTLAMYAETEYELRLALTLACVEAERGAKQQ